MAINDRFVTDYQYYCVGCSKMGWNPLLYTEFHLLYVLYLECKNPLKDPASEWVWRTPFKSISLPLPFNLSKVQRRERIKKQLNFLETAIKQGKISDDNGTDTTGIKVRPIPMPPSRSGSATREFPPQDFI